MKISDIKIFPVSGQKTIKANGSCILENFIEVKFMIMQGEKGLFATLKGSEKYTDKSGQQKYSPAMYIKEEADREQLQKELKAAYSEKVQE